ncbi:MAG: hypothetical protein HQM09_01710 [Candidatus Riflebacteria bacterium]|nr:hypothetical protein [Candidatus Riflebacteria bacterium]
MRRILSALIGFSLFVGTLVFVPTLYAGTLEQWSGRLEAVEDQEIRQTLQNSIIAGLIVSPADFDTALACANSRKNGGNPHNGGNTNGGSLNETIAKLSASIPQLDRDAVAAQKGDGMRGHLFEPIIGNLPPSFEAAYNLAIKFDPRSGTNDAPRLDKDIDAFLAVIADDPVIKQALSSTGTTISDLKRNWFGPGLGFEHVIAGEIKGSEVSGYHWWYKFYRDEIAGNAKYISTMGNVGDQHAYTGQFSWDPDGDGPLPRAVKHKGGFIIGNSVQAILALGHIAIESARKLGNIPGAFTFDANVNGETFTWQCYTISGSIRSLYPMGGKAGLPAPADASREYYELEEDAAKALNHAGSLTVH